MVFYSTYTEIIPDKTSSFHGISAGGVISGIVGFIFLASFLCLCGTMLIIRADGSCLFAFDLGRWGDLLQSKFSGQMRVS